MPVRSWPITVAVAGASLSRCSDLAIVSAGESRCRRAGGTRFLHGHPGSLRRGPTPPRWIRSVMFSQCAWLRGLPVRPAQEDLAPCCGGGPLVAVGPGERTLVDWTDRRGRVTVAFRSSPREWPGLEDLAVGENGSAVLVWQSRRSTRLRARYLSPSGWFGPTSTISSRLAAQEPGSTGGRDRLSWERLGRVGPPVCQARGGQGRLGGEEEERPAVHGPQADHRRDAGR